MYINDLGIGRTDSVHNTGYAARTANTVSRKKTGSYASVMKKAVDNQKTVEAAPSFATAGDIIIKEAFDKMKTDPEWEASVINKVKEYYNGNYAAGSARLSYLNWMGQNSLQSYMLQGLAGGQSSLGLAGYSPYGFGGLAATAYGNMMNSALGSSLFGSWQL